MGYQLKLIRWRSPRQPAPPLDQRVTLGLSLISKFAAKDCVHLHYKPSDAAVILVTPLRL